MGDKIGRITPTGAITDYRSADRRQPPRRNRGRPGRQPVVHRAWRVQDRADHPDRGRHRIPPAQASTAGNGDITAGPDGNMWFTGLGRDRADHPERRRHRVPPAQQRHPLGGSRRARTATCGSPGPTRTRSGGSPRPATSPNTPSPPPTVTLSGSRPARTATCGSPRCMGTRSGGSPRPAPSPNTRCPSTNSYPRRITAGPDGNLWFTEPQKGSGGSPPPLLPRM